MLEIKNLTVRVDDKNILDGPEPHREDAARSPPSWGRTGPASRPCPTSSPARPDYEVLDGEILLNGENILAMEPDERAAAGVFLAFQYPLEIPGVGTMTFLKAALNAQLQSARRRTS